MGRNRQQKARLSQKRPTLFPMMFQQRLLLRIRQMVLEKAQITGPLKETEVRQIPVLTRVLQARSQVIRMGMEDTVTPTVMEDTAIRIIKGRPQRWNNCWHSLAQTPEDSTNLTTVQSLVRVVQEAPGAQEAQEVQKGEREPMVIIHKRQPLRQEAMGIIQLLLISAPVEKPQQSPARNTNQQLQLKQMRTAASTQPLSQLMAILVTLMHQHRAEMDQVWVLQRPLMGPTEVKRQRRAGTITTKRTKLLPPHPRLTTMVAPTKSSQHDTVVTARRQLHQLRATTTTTGLLVRLPIPWCNLSDTHAIRLRERLGHLLVLPALTSARILPLNETMIQGFRAISRLRVNCCK
uniref:Uncharacterized protein n=1 Tax=Ixodes ricinus TaxID=34613 RepID=V5IDY8_IXORI